MTIRVARVRKHVLLGWVPVPRALWAGGVASLEAMRICVPGIRITGISFSNGLGLAEGEPSWVVPSAAPAGNGAEITP